jgi:glucitol operon activator protein
MPIWQICLILLVVMWILQAVGTWLQMRHYRSVMRSIEGRWNDGYLGIGNARSSFGRGVILMVVVGPDETVRELLTMEGRSVLAKFKPLEEFRGRSLASLREDEAFNKVRGRAKALDQAIQQIEKASSKQLGPSAMLSEHTA